MPNLGRARTTRRSQQLAQMGNGTALVVRDVLLYSVQRTSDSVLSAAEADDNLMDGMERSLCLLEVLLMVSKKKKNKNIYLCTE